MLTCAVISEMLWQGGHPCSIQDKLKKNSGDHLTFHLQVHSFNLSTIWSCCTYLYHMSYRMLAASNTVCLVILSATDQSIVFSSSICISARLRLAVFVCGWTADCFRTGSLTCISQCRLSFVLQFMKKKGSTVAQRPREYDYNMTHEVAVSRLNLKWKAFYMGFLRKIPFHSYINKSVPCSTMLAVCIYLLRWLMTSVPLLFFYFSGFCLSQNQVGGNLLICNWRECHCECQR